MLRSSITRAILLLVMACALLGCGSTAPAVTSVSIPSGWQTFNKSGLAFALPPGWQVLAADDTNFAGAMDELVQQNPRLQPVAEQARKAVAGGQVKVLAFDLSPDGVLPNFTNNLSIGIQPMGRSASLAQVASANEEQLRSSGFSDVKRSSFTSGGQEFAHLSSTLSITDATGESLPLAFEQWVMVKGQQQYVLTFATIAEQRKDLRPVFEKIVGTFRPE